MSTLRIIAECWPSNIFYKTYPDGTAWHGAGMWRLNALKTKLPPFEVITDLSVSNTTWNAIQTLADGRAEVSPDLWGVTYQRSQVVDFSYPSKVYGTFIYSAKQKGSAVSNAVFGVFDGPSCGLIIVALMIMSFLTWVVNDKEKSRKQSFAETATYVFGNCVHQPPFKSIIPKSRFGQVMMLLFVVYNLIITIMYSSIVISILTSKPKSKGIQTLEDLQSKQNENVRIWVRRNSYMMDHLIGMKTFDELSAEGRVSYYEVKSTEDEAFFFEDMLQSVLNHSHVIIASEGNLKSLLKKIVHRTQTCSMRIRDFKRARDPVFSTLSVWLYRKGMAWREKLDKELMWLDAFGLMKMKENDGIWSDEVMEGECDDIPDLDELCQSKPKKTAKQRKYSPLNYDHFIPISRTYCAMILLAILAFLCELIQASNCRRRLTTYKKIKRTRGPRTKKLDILWNTSEKRPVFSMFQNCNIL